MEMRGNRELFNGDKNIGVHEICNTLHFGPDRNHNAYYTARFEKNSQSGFHQDFHNYKLEWTPEHLKFFVNNELVGTVDAGGKFYMQ